MRLIASGAFRQAWADLWKACSWATAFQRPEFVEAWIRCYGHDYEPILVTATDSHDKLVGLLPLALDRQAGNVVGAGSYHAEYQTWLHTADLTNFPAMAMQAVRNMFPGRSIHLKYLPPETPVSALLLHTELGPLIHISRHRRPLMRIGAAGDPANKHRTAKRRLNQLKRLGAVTFRCLDSPHELRDILPTLSAFYDLRQGALHGNTPFHGDPDKASFHETLFERMGHFAKVFVLELNSEPIAGLFSVVTRDTAHNCVIAHSPTLARCSPGSVLLMTLADAGPTYGISQIDLTPGGDPWKERYANRYEEVSKLLIYASARYAYVHKQIARLVELGKKVIAVLGIMTAHRRRAASLLADYRRLSVLLATLRKRLWERRELRVYRMPLPGSPVVDCDLMQRDCIQHLLCFRPAERWQTRQSFFAAALERLERGEHLYTFVQDGQLINFGWLVEEQREARFSEVQQQFAFPPGSAVVYDFFTTPSARSQGYYHRALRQMVRAANTIPGARYLYITVLANNRPSRHVIERLGFTFQGSLYYRRILWLAKRWQDMVVPSAPAVEPRG